MAYSHERILKKVPVECLAGLSRETHFAGGRGGDSSMRTTSPRAIMRRAGTARTARPRQEMAW